MICNFDVIIPLPIKYIGYTATSGLVSRMKDFTKAVLCRCAQHYDPLFFQAWNFCDAQVQLPW